MSEVSIDQLLCNKVQELAQEEVRKMLESGSLVHVTVINDDAPFMEYEKFANWVGSGGKSSVTAQVVRGWVENPRLPQFKKVKHGARVFVDVDHYRAYMVNHKQETLK